MGLLPEDVNAVPLSPNVIHEDAHEELHFLNNRLQAVLTAAAGQPIRKAASGNDFEAYTLATGANPMDPPYNAKGDGVAIDTIALRDCFAANKFVSLPPNRNFKIDGEVALQRGQVIAGPGYESTRITLAGAHRGLVHEPTVLTEAGIGLHGFRIIGTPSLALDLVAFKNAAGVQMSGMNIRGTTRACIEASRLYRLGMYGFNRIEDFALYGLNLVDQCSEFSLDNVDIQSTAAAVAGHACLRIVGGGEGNVDGCNPQGASFTNTVGVRLEGANNVGFRGGFYEGFDGPAFLALGTVPCINIDIERLNMAASDSATVDFGGTLAHRNIGIRHNRFPQIGVGAKAFVPGATASFEYIHNDLEGGGVHVNGYARANVIKRPGYAGAAIASPTADVTDLKRAVDEVRAALTALGITA